MPDLLTELEVAWTTEPGTNVGAHWGDCHMTHPECALHAAIRLARHHQLKRHQLQAAARAALLAGATRDSIGALRHLIPDDLQEPT